MIDIKGQVEFQASARLAVTSLQKEEQLSRFLPSDSTIVATGEHSFDFVIEKDIGIVRVKAAGTLTTEPTQTDQELHFRAAAKHLIGGSAVVDMLISFKDEGPQCTMSYAGTVSGTGLLGAFLSQREEKVHRQLENTFKAFGNRMEGIQRIVTARRAEREAQT
jgi:carbon monoxide dehydrogenase subunit G